MKTYTDCDVRFDDDMPSPKFRQGRVTVNGRDATFWRKDEKRYVQVDRFTNVKVTESHSDTGEDLVIVGESRQAINDRSLRGKDAVATAHVHSRGGCQTC